MAGVTPQQRGGSGVTTVVTVIAIVVAVLSLCAWIPVFMGREQMRSDAAKAVQAKNRLARANDERVAKQLVPEAGSAGTTIVGSLNNSMKNVCKLLTGDENDTPQIAGEKLTAALDDLQSSGGLPEGVTLARSDGAVAIIQNLAQLYANERSSREAMETDRDKLTADLEQARASADELKAEFESRHADIEAKFNELQQAKLQYESLRNEETAALENQLAQNQDRLNSIRRERSDMAREAVSELQRLESMLVEQRQAIATFRNEGMPQAAEPMALARRAVGTILRALPGDSLVHVDLGREDNVCLGMTFSVYSSDARVPADGIGKATLEVVSVGRKTAECRVTTPPSPDDPILEGDRIGNIVLSRNRARPTRICVVGNFDTDFDDSIDPRGRKEIEALAARYGAELVDTVDATTDFVVVGLEPAAGEEEWVESSVADKLSATAEASEVDDLGDDELLDDLDDEEFEDDTDVSADDEDDEFLEDDFAEDDEDEFVEDEDETADDDAVADDDDEAAEDDDDAVAEDEEDEEDDDEFIDDEEDDDDVESRAAWRNEEVSGDKNLGIDRGQPVDPTAKPRTQRAKSARQKYFDAIRRAEMFAIPRLTQDRFLHFVGLEPGPATTRLLRQ